MTEEAPQRSTAVPTPATPDVAVRRAPFSDNPRVGVHGQRTQQRILDAALQAFGEEGYHACSIVRITKLARCSRVSFYQYFASKEEVFQHLAGQVARQVSASTEALSPLTPDLAGRSALRAWVARYTEIYARYEPVFHALESDNALAAYVSRTGDQTVARVHSRLASTTLAPRQIDPVIRLLLEALNHALEITDILRSAAADGYPTGRVEDAITDVLHRTFFGLRPGVNVHPAEGPPPPVLEFGASMLDLLRGDDALEPQSPANQTLAALLDAGREVFVERGDHDTRVDDLVAAAGVSHGAFYRHFASKDQLARLLTARAMPAVGAAIRDIPDLPSLEGPSGRARLRRWLRRYHAAQSSEAAMLHVWMDAALQEPALRAESAPTFDWGRRRMAKYLQPRDFGDDEMDAIVLVSLLAVFGARKRPAAEVEAAALIVERGLLGR